jgi:hypothetical protein
MAELNVGLIMARSPQAKGRVERSNGVLQDRLVKELALAGVAGIDAANAWLESSTFFEKLDDRFAIAAADGDADAHRPLVSVLADVLCVKERRSVGLDGCVQWRGRVLQLAGAGALRSVEVWERFDACGDGDGKGDGNDGGGALTLWGDGRRLAWTELDDAARQAKQAKSLAGKKRRPIVNNKPFTPNARQRITLGRPTARAATATTAVATTRATATARTAATAATATATTMATATTTTKTATKTTATMVTQPRELGPRGTLRTTG